MKTRLPILALAVALLWPAAARPAEKSPKPFTVGAYLYDYQIRDAARTAGEEFLPFLGRQFETLKRNHLNAVYLAIGPSTLDVFPEVLALAKANQLSVVPQLDFAYFRADETGWTPEVEAAAAARAADFINRFGGDPAIPAVSVREEVPARYADALAHYYRAILSLAPQAKFQKIHNDPEAAARLPEPHPRILGVDRYAFWWEFSGGGYLATPRFSLDWVNRQLARYHAAAAGAGADFWLVLNPGSLRGSMSAGRLARLPGAVRERVLAYAAEQRFGWSFRDPKEAGELVYWKYYRVPRNCMRALMWTGVAHGARGIFLWSWAPATPRQMESGRISLAGWPEIPNPQLEEVKSTAAELQRLSPLLTRMEKRPDAPVSCGDPEVVLGAFQLPGTRGTILVAVNLDVGTWPGGSKRMFKPGDDVRITETADLAGYTPHRTPRRIVLQSDAPLYLLPEGKPLAAGEDGRHGLDLAPGGGAVLFQGSAEELETLRKETLNTASTGPSQP